MSKPLKSMLTRTILPTTMLSGPRQKFAEGVAAGLNQTVAYLAAYPKASDETARRAASVLMTKHDIITEIARIRASAALLPGSAVLTLADKRNGLAAIFRSNGEHLGSEVKTSDRLRALELDAKLAGELKDKVEVTGETVIKVTIGA